MDLLDQADRIAIELTLAIKGGDIRALERLLAARPGLATVGILIEAGPTPTRSPAATSRRRRCTGRPAATTPTWPRH